MVGTAPNANFWLLRGENVNSEYPIEEHNWDAAAEFADSAGTDLISSSLGYFTFDDPQFNHTYNDIYKNTTIPDPVYIKKRIRVPAGYCPAHQ